MFLSALLLWNGPMILTDADFVVWVFLVGLFWILWG